MALVCMDMLDFVGPPECPELNQKSVKNGHYVCSHARVLNTENELEGWVVHIVVRALDLRLHGREFDSGPPRLILDG